jgi:hypothetical protein
MKQILLTWQPAAGELGNGEAQGIDRLPTSTCKYILRTVFTDCALNLGDEVTVRIIDRLVKTYIFLEDMGWTPCELGEPETRFERRGELQYAPGLTLSTGRYIVYNEVFAKLLPIEKEKSK